MIFHRTVAVDGYNVFYREAGSAQNAPVMVLLHGFPSSSHMYRDLVPLLSSHFRVIAPDYLGFGYSAMPSVEQFQYSFDTLTRYVEQFLFSNLGLTRFHIYVQDYGAPIGFRLAALHPEAIEGIVVQNGNAYPEGISPAFEPLKPFWQHRDVETEKAARALLTPEMTRIFYLQGAKDATLISPDTYTLDQALLDRPGNDLVQLQLLHDYPSNLALYEEWHRYFREHQPPMLIMWGKNDPFFTVKGAQAFLRDLPDAELHLLDAGHFALEEQTCFIAQRIITRFSSGNGKAAA